MNSGTTSAAEQPHTRLIQIGPPGARCMEVTGLSVTRDFRAAVRAVGREHGLGRLELCCLLVGVEEAVANALAHGEPPVTAGVWADARLVQVVVHDHGRVPFTPGIGLQAMRALVDHVHLSMTAGTTVSLGQHLLQGAS